MKFQVFCWKTTRLDGSDDKAGRSGRLSTVFLILRRGKWEKVPRMSKVRWTFFILWLLFVFQGNLQFVKCQRMKKCQQKKIVAQLKELNIRNSCSDQKKTYNHSTRARHLRFFNFIYFLEGLKGFRGSSKLCPSINHVSRILTFSAL